MINITQVRTKFYVSSGKVSFWKGKVLFISEFIGAYGYKSIYRFFGTEEEFKNLDKVEEEI